MAFHTTPVSTVPGERRVPLALKFTAICLVIVGTLLTSTGCSYLHKRPQGDDLFTVGRAVPVSPTDSALLERRRLLFNAERLQPGQAATVALRLRRETVRLGVDPVPAEDLGLPEAQSAWVGRTDDGSELFVMRIGRGFEAQLTRGPLVYRIRTANGIDGFLEVYDARRFREAPNDGVRGPETRTEGPSGDSSCLDPPSRIDVMVLYTPDARDGSGGVTEIENEIAFAVGRTNLSYANSNAAHRLNLIYTGLANYNEPAAGVDSNALLGDLRGTSDGVLDTIHGLRDAVRADLVSLFYEVDDSSWCGWGNTVENANADTTDDRGFTVVQRSCAGGYLSFAHEVGHNLGARHDRDNAGASSLGFNFGHIEPEPTSALSPWRTVMSYPDPCGDVSATGFCQRVPWFSNPGVSRSGDATGVPLSDPEPEHNVNAFAQNDAHVSRYRCLRRAVDDPYVWMKDRWNDEGGEPDPATAGQRMWQSPYIWVRNSEDAALEHEHEHQDPELGIDNHVYVKVHNDGGASQSGDLELYFAAASTNLNNPANWIPIGSQAQTIGVGVEVFHFTWSGLPGEGHYCLLARWNEDGSALSFTSIDPAVRNDNDLIWRNVNIVDLSGDLAESTGDFLMAGHPEYSYTYLVLEAKPRNQPSPDWRRLVQVAVTIDSEALATAPAVRGLDPIGRGRFVLPVRGGCEDGERAPASIGPFRIPAGQTIAIGLDFEVDRDAVRAAQRSLANPAYFEITASQVAYVSSEVAAGADRTVVLGGVTFELMIPSTE